jgi:predicted type IV restriction endonuclease
LMAFIQNLKTDQRIGSFDEAATKQVIVAKLLSLLGWNMYNIDEVTPEYSVGEKRVDYSLRIGNVNKVFIEVKRTQADLERESHQKQLLSYSFQQGVRLAILTNGVTWWSYLPLCEGRWEQRKAYSIDILQQEPTDVASRFVDFLSRENVASGAAVENAEAVYKGQQKTSTLKETVPKAWNKIIEEADDLLVELINETTEKLCGFKADSQLIGEFLSTHKERLTIGETPPPRPAAPTRPAVHRAKPQPVRESYTHKSISSFYFRGSRYDVRSWKNLLLKLCDILNAAHPTDFDRTLSIRGKKRVYFTRNKEDLKSPQRIGNTDVLAETNFNANEVVKICFRMLATFGYSRDDLRIEAH